MEQQCPICILPLEVNFIATLPCGHQLCSKCIGEYILYSNKCPICVKEFLSFQGSEKEQAHQLSQNDLNVISDQKKKFSQEESFDCITREEVRKQMKELKYMADQLSTRLFSCRTTEQGSEKEEKVLGGVYEDMAAVEELLEMEEFQGTDIMNSLNGVIIGIQELKARKYVSD